MSFNSVDFTLVCAGTGMLIVSIAWAAKILGDSSLFRSKPRLERQRSEPPVGRQPIEVSDDGAFSNRLREIQAGRFGKSLTAEQTWPILKRRVDIKKPPEPKITIIDDREIPTTPKKKTTKKA